MAVKAGEMARERQGKEKKAKIAKKQARNAQKIAERQAKAQRHQMAAQEKSGKRHAKLMAMAM